MVAWKPKGGPNIGKSSSPFTTQDMLGGGGGGPGYTALRNMPVRNIPKASTNTNPGRMHTSEEHKGSFIRKEGKIVDVVGLPTFGGGPKNITPSNVQRSSGTGRSVGKGFSTKHAKTMNKVRKIKEEVLSDYQKALNRYDPEKSARDAGFASHADWLKALKGETNAEKSKFYGKKRGDH